jgi:gamma-glutamylcyclotransferase (GGCT)/AIG2-like uncharacterized protein YtfP
MDRKGTTDGSSRARASTGGSRVAVYGTLKTGEANYHRFLAGRSPLFRGFVEIPYRMYANDSYPMLVPSTEKHRIFVEIFEVDEGTLESLDALEEPYDYRREPIHVSEAGMEAAVYIHDSPPPIGFSPVSAGEWSSESKSS